MNILNPTKYHKKCDVIKKLILKEFVNHAFAFDVNPINLHFQVTVNNYSKFTVLEDNTWGEIKRNIIKRIKLQKNGLTDPCPICYDIIEKNTTCNRCSNSYCNKCYINLFKHGQGIVTCPHCRYSIGVKIPEWAIPLGVMEIKNNFKMVD